MQVDANPELIVKFEHIIMLKRNNIVITWPSHHASVSMTSTGVRRTEANKNRPKYKNDCIQHNNIKFLHIT